MSTIKTPDAPNRYRILEFRAQNVKAIKAICIKPNPGDSVVKLTGRNRQGKTSIVDSIWSALGGSACIPSRPIKDGEDKGEIFLDLGEYRITRTFTAKGEYLEVKNKDGFDAPKPQKFLSSRLGDRAENPLKFMRLGPADQVKALQNMVTIFLDLKEYEQITGLSSKGLDKVDPIKLLDDSHKVLYDKRTDVNKEVTRLTGVSKSYDIPKDKEGTQKVLVTELFEVRKVLETQKTANEKIRLELSQIMAKGEAAKTAITAKAKEIAEVEKKLLELKGEKSKLLLDLQDLKIAYKAKETEVKALVEPDFTTIDEQIKTADETNRIATQIEERTKTMQELAAKKTESEDLTKKLEGLKIYKTDLIAEAGLPVKGLGFENGEVTFNGLPLSQASGREQRFVSCAICAAQNPEIAILTMDEGWNELDKESQKDFEDFATQHGLQIWITSVQEEPGSQGFHIVAGEVAAIDGVPVETEQQEETSKEEVPTPTTEPTVEAQPGGDDLTKALLEAASIVPADEMDPWGIPEEEPPMAEEEPDPVPPSFMDDSYDPFNDAKEGEL